MEEQGPKKEKNPEAPENKDLGQFAKYSGIVVQMFVIIFITTWGGMKLDKLAAFSKPVFTIILSLLGVFSAIYVAIKDFIKK